MNSAILFLSLIVQLTILWQLRRLNKAMNIGNEILELSAQLKRRSDALQQAIDSQSKPNQKGK